MKIPGSLFFLLMFLASCDNSKDPLRKVEKFYFPIEELVEGKIYEYLPLGNENDPPVYWYYKTEIEGKSKFLTGTSFGPAFIPDQFIREEKVDNGILLREFITWERTGSGNILPVTATIEDPNIFSFKVKKYGSVLVTSIKWTSLSDSSNYTFVRNRQFEADTTFTFAGKKTDAVRFVTRELVDQEQQGHLELEYGGVEVYAKGIGLVSFRKDIDEGWQMAYELAKTYTAMDFEKQFGVRLEDIIPLK